MLYAVISPHQSGASVTAISLQATTTTTTPATTTTTTTAAATTTTTTTAADPDFIKSAVGAHTCQDGYQVIHDKTTCREAMNALDAGTANDGLDHSNTQW